MLHGAERIGNMRPDPRNRNVRLYFPELLKRHASLVNATSLCETRNVNSMTSGHTVPQLDGFATIADGFVITSGKIMRCRQAHVEDSVLWIVRAHPNCLLRTKDRALRLPVE